MESLLKPLKMNPDTNRVLEEIRNGAENALYGAAPAASDELFHKHVESLIEGAGLPNLQVIHYRWFLRDVARLWRTRQGRDLAFHLELCLRKWVNLGLEPRTLQFLICEAHSRLKGKDLTTKAQSHEEPAKTGTVPHAECSKGLSPVFAPETPPAESAKSADGLRDPSTPLLSTQGDSASSAESVDNVRSQP